MIVEIIYTMADSYNAIFITSYNDIIVVKHDSIVANCRIARVAKNCDINSAISV